MQEIENIFFGFSQILGDYYFAVWVVGIVALIILGLVYFIAER
jgi:hypothetical protein